MTPYFGLSAHSMPGHAASVWLAHSCSKYQCCTVSWVQLMAEILHQFMLPPIPPRLNVDVCFFHPGWSSKKINIEQGGCGGVICLEEFAGRVVQDFVHQPLQQKKFEVPFFLCALTSKCSSSIRWRISWGEIAIHSSCLPGECCEQWMWTLSGLLWRPIRVWF